jgi:hypothetical protein
MIPFSISFYKIERFGKRNLEMDTHIKSLYFDSKSLFKVEVLFFDKKKLLRMLFI